MNAKTILKLAILSLVVVTAQAHAESGGAPIRLVWKILAGIAAEARMLARCRAANSADHSVQCPALGAAAVLLFTGLYAAPWSAFV